MSEKKRPSGEDLARDLFDAGKDEAPSAASRAKAMAALGLDAPAAPPRDGGEGGASGGGGALKWLGGAILVGAVGAAVVLSRGEDPPKPSLPQPSATVGAAPPAASSAAPVESAPPAAPASVESAAVAPSASAPKPVVKVAPSASAGEDTLANEIAALDRARASLASDPSRSLEELARYDAAFPRGSLRNEAVVLRVEALVKAGRREEAERIGQAFLKAHPSDLSGQRVRRLLDAP